VRPYAISLALALAALLAPAAVRAQSASATSSSQPLTRLVVNFDLGFGGELGLSHGKAGVVELEGVLGYDLDWYGLRPEFALAVGFEPDSNVAVRPGVRWTVPNLPLQVRAALDASNARDNWHWRWLLFGAATEIRFTSQFGLFAEADSGFPLASPSGVPLLVRVGASFRF
jgi:hypothetical protein